VGVDTVRLSYSFGTGERWSDLVSRGVDSEGRAIEQVGGFSSRRHDSGSVGPVWWRTYAHDGLRNSFTIKGVRGSSVVGLYEGSVPKELGVCGAAPADCVDVLDTYLRGLLREAGLLYVHRGAVRRCDLTFDASDPDGLLRLAALGWNPHKRSRYTQAVHDDRATEGHTVFQHNKTRGVRVYDKFHECGEDWAKDLTRIEYQVRGDWLEKYGIAVGCDWDAVERSYLGPLVADLTGRAAQLELHGPGDGT